MSADSFCRNPGVKGQESCEEVAWRRRRREPAVKRGHRHQLPRMLRVQPPGWAQRGAGSIGIMGTKLGLWGPNPTSANSRGGGWWPGAAGWAGTWGRGGSWQRLRFPGVIWKLVPRNSAPAGLSTHKTQCRGRTWGLSELQAFCFQSVQCKPSASPAYAACWLPKLGWGFLVGQLTAAPGVPLGVWGQVLSLHGCHILAKSCASSLCRMEAGA